MDSMVLVHSKRAADGIMHVGFDSPEAGYV